MSAVLSSLPPPPSSRGPGLVRALHRGDCYDRATPRELKAEAIRLRELTGMGKRETARAYRKETKDDEGTAWETVRGYLDPRALDRTPPVRFVRWLKHKADAAASERLALEALG